MAAEGIERPTSLQRIAIPVVTQGSNAFLHAGPGSGLVAAWAVGLLQRLEPGGETDRALVLAHDEERAEWLAEAVAALVSANGHSVGALGGRWAEPEKAQIVCGTPRAVLGAITGGKLTLDGVSALVVDQAQLIESSDGLAVVERVLDYLPSETQRLIAALPATDGVTDLVSRHVKRAARIPPPIPDSPPDRGWVRFRIVPEPREEGVLDVVGELLRAGAAHVLVFCSTEDRAADVGDHLTLHGFVAGAPGETECPVWLGVDPLAARAACEGIAGVIVVSCDAPADPDELDRRHGISPDGVVVVQAREIAHLRHLGKVTGYDTVPFPPLARPDGPAERLRSQIEAAITGQDVSTYAALLAPLFERHDPVEVAAAAVALMRSGSGSAPAKPDASPPETAAPGREPAWAKLFLSVGERDGLRKGDLVGAITGEAGVKGDAVGRIEIRESHSLVEVHDAVAKKVIRAINGTTIKGRSVRADFDRPRRGGAPKGRRPR